MSGKFTIAEILKIAMRIEENGAPFYRLLSERTNSEKIRDIFEILALAEERHNEKYQNMYQRLKKFELKETFPGDTELYLKALADEAVFNEDKKAENIFKKIESDQDAINFAFEYEFISIKFFTAMKKVVPVKDRRIVKEIIKEENMHVKHLENLQKDISIGL